MALISVTLSTDKQKLSKYCSNEHGNANERWVYSCSVPTNPPVRSDPQRLSITSSMTGPGEVFQIQQLVQQRDSIKNALDHLQRSQRELSEAIDHEGDEEGVFKSAIEENIVVIARYRAQIERLEKEIDCLRANIHSMQGGTTPALASKELESVCGVRAMGGPELASVEDEGEACREVVMQHAWSAQRCRDEDDSSDGVHL